MWLNVVPKALLIAKFDDEILITKFYILFKWGWCCGRNMRRNLKNRNIHTVHVLKGLTSFNTRAQRGFFFWFSRYHHCWRLVIICYDLFRLSRKTNPTLWWLQDNPLKIGKDIDENMFSFGRNIGLLPLVSIVLKN